MVTRERFTNCFYAFKKRHKTEGAFLKSDVKISSESAWLSAFFEGDEGFYIKRSGLIRTRKKRPCQKRRSQDEL